MPFSRSRGYVRVTQARNQRAALAKLVHLAEQSSVDPDIRNLALQITEACHPPGQHPDEKTDECELEAIFKFVRENVSYVSDPRYRDFFTTPRRLLKNCEEDPALCAEDCDGHTAFVLALCISLGFLSGARAWGEKKNEFVHVYPVVCLPKVEPDGQIKRIVALDTTVDEAYVGWEPGDGYVTTAWVEDPEKFFDAEEGD